MVEIDTFIKIFSDLKLEYRTEIGFLSTLPSLLPLLSVVRTNKSDLSLFFFLDFIVVVEGLYASVSCDFDDV